MNTEYENEFSTGAKRRCRTRPSVEATVHDPRSLPNRRQTAKALLNAVLVKAVSPIRSAVRRSADVDELVVPSLRVRLSRIVDGVMIGDSTEDLRPIDGTFVVERDAENAIGPEALQDVHVVRERGTLRLVATDSVVPTGPSQTLFRQDRGVRVGHRVVALVRNAERVSRSSSDGSASIASA